MQWYLYHCYKLRYAQPYHYHNRQHRRVRTVVNRGWKAQKGPRGFGGLIAIMAWNRLVTAETGNVSISDGRSNAYAFASCHESADYRISIFPLDLVLQRLPCDYNRERKIAIHNLSARKKVIK